VYKCKIKPTVVTDEKRKMYHKCTNATNVNHRQPKQKEVEGLKPVYKLLTELSSRKTISQITGKLAKSKVSKGFIPHFAKTYRINVQEAEKEIHEYPTLNSFFTRRLKEGARTIDTKPEVLVSPVDAVITGIGEIKEGTILNVKGQRYTIAEMLDDPERMAPFQNGSFIVLYLSPTDYHRIHAPIEGKITKQVHKEGKYYPVNDFGLKHMKRVLSRNERSITYMSNDYTEVAVVKVGALNVASIVLNKELDQQKVERGEELAYFEFGSTVVLLMKEGTFTFKSTLHEGDSVKLGQALGKLNMS
jgi:phosphatidylserine decarboxylase